MISDPASARLALLVQYAMDTRAGSPGNLAPAADPRLAPDWRLLGNITGRDSIFRLLGPISPGETVHYGFLLQSTGDPEQYVVIIRGTYGLAEWAEDGECVPRPHPVAGKVELGFYGIYESMRYAPLGGAGEPLEDGLAQAVGGDDCASRLTVVGHSLGSALATFATFGLAAALHDRVSGLFFASPRPGDAVFGRAFDERVRHYQHYAFEPDVVPQVPRGPDYATLPRTTIIAVKDAQARIREDIGCFHHVLCYAAELGGYWLADWAAMAKIDQSCASCILGPAIVTAQAAA